MTREQIASLTKEVKVAVLLMNPLKHLSSLYIHSWTEKILTSAQARSSTKIYPCVKQVKPIFVQKSALVILDILRMWTWVSNMKQTLPSSFLGVVYGKNQKWLMSKALLWPTTQLLNEIVSSSCYPWYDFSFQLGETVKKRSWPTEYVSFERSF